MRTALRRTFTKPHMALRGAQRFATMPAADKTGAEWARRLGMLAGALVFPVAFGMSTYFEGHRDVFRPEYRSGTQTANKEQQEAAAANGEAPPQEQPKSASQHASNMGGAFTMRSAATRRLVTDVDVLKGKWTLLYFGFTKCAEICPNTMKFIVGVMDECESQHKAKHPTEAASLQTVFVTIDTVRDGAPELLEFLSRFRKDRRGLVGLYGDDEQTQHIAKAWRVFFTSFSETPEEVKEREKRGFATLKDAIAADDKYQFDHSAAVYLIGPDGKLRDFYFKELGAEHAVSRIGLHFDDCYGLNGIGGKASPTSTRASS